MKTLLVISRVVVVLTVIGTVTFMGYGAYFRYEARAAMSDARQLDDGSFVLSFAGQEIPSGRNVVQITQFFDVRDAGSFALYRHFRQALSEDDKIVYLIRPVGFRDPDARALGLFLMAARRADGAKATRVVRRILEGGIPVDMAGVHAMAQDEGLDVAAITSRIDDLDVRKSEYINFKLMKKAGFYTLPAMIVGSKGYRHIAKELPSVNFIKMMVFEERKKGV